MERLALRELSSLKESFCGSICLVSTEAFFVCVGGGGEGRGLGAGQDDRRMI